MNCKKLKLKKIPTCILTILVGFFFSSLLPSASAWAASPTPGPGGTYSDWYFPGQSYDSLEWTFVPLQDPPASMAQSTPTEYYGSLHYYAYNFGLVNSTGAIGRGYAGFQSNGIFNGKGQGKVINFSIWGSNGGNSSGMVNAANSESGGYQIMMKYVWSLNHKYAFQLKQGPSGTDSNGKWWGLWVKDQDTGVETFVGEQRVPSVIDGKSATAWEPHTSMFGEDTHWWYSINGSVVYKCGDFPSSAMAAVNITANGSEKSNRLTTTTSSGQTYTSDTGYQTTACDVTVYKDSQNNVQHNLGYWSSPATNQLSTILTGQLKPETTSTSTNDNSSTTNAADNQQTSNSGEQAPATAPPANASETGAADVTTQLSTAGNPLRASQKQSATTPVASFRKVITVGLIGLGVMLVGGGTLLFSLMHAKPKVSPGNLNLIHSQPLPASPNQMPTDVISPGKT